MSERRRFVVSGAHKDTGQPVSLTVEAPSAEKAEAGIRKRGILVSSVEPAPMPYATPETPSGATFEDEDERNAVHVRNVSRGAAFRIGFYGGLGAMASWVALWIVVGFVLFVLGTSLPALLRLLGF